MLWISLYLPDLSLQSHARGAIGHLQDVALVISDGVASRPHVHAANRFAREAGITPPMPVAAAQASAPNLVIVPRDATKEHDALDLIASWLTQFSPMVCRENAGASLEISSTLRLFGGLNTLATRIRRGIRELGFHASTGIAPTPLAAWLLAKEAHHQPGIRMCRESAELSTRLTDIPLEHFEWPVEIKKPLAELGLVRIRDLLGQPRAGLRRRLGDQVLHDLDRALGRTGDPREPHCVPEHFSGSTDLLFDIIDADRLLIPIRMLLNGMEGFMRARGAGASEIVLDLKHNRTFRTTHRFGSRHPLRGAEDWLRLIRERLTAHPFPEAVVGLKLSATQLIPFQEKNDSWLPEPEAHGEKWQALIERIASRLGDKSVFSLSEQSDHRPELAWKEDKQVCAEADREVKPPKSATAKNIRPRPLMLLREPLSLVTLDGAPQHHGALSLLAGPERIDTGWWDGHLVARDYYVAANPENEICWVFRDYRHGKKWYLHGYFS